MTKRTELKKRLEVAREVKSEKRTSERKRDEQRDMIRHLAAEEAEVPLDQVSVNFIGQTLTEPIIYIRDTKTGIETPHLMPGLEDEAPTRR